MSRAIIFVLDSFGVGGGRDAAAFGDEGSDTFGHIAAACATGAGDREGLRHGALKLPNMDRLGLGAAAERATGNRPAGFDGDLAPGAFFGAADERSSGKDTPSGHWEIAGVPVTFDWAYFPQTIPTFPAKLTRAIVAEAGLPGILGDRHASGTEIIAELGEEHIRTGKPIFYTSSDSVVQIAAHETHFGLERLHDLCLIVRRLVDPLNIGRVIARPFIGESAADFVRTSNRRDYAVPPPEPTLLDRAEAAARTVHAVGKIGDIFAHRGVTRLTKAPDNMAMVDRALDAMELAADGDFIFANFVDFDMLFGHRRDVPGYAAALEDFDRRLPEALEKLRPDDLLILTADHGCDPTWRGTDHTRERVPVFGMLPGATGGALGVRDSFADIGETVADHLGLRPGRHGRSFLPLITGGDA